MRRELRSVRTERPLGGAVVRDDAGKFRFEAGGGRYLAPMIEALGSEAAAREAFESGASNGYWYFAPVEAV